MQFPNSFFWEQKSEETFADNRERRKRFRGVLHMGCIRQARSRHIRISPPPTRRNVPEPHPQSRGQNRHVPNTRRRPRNQRRPRRRIRHRRRSERRGRQTRQPYQRRQAHRPNVGDRVEGAPQHHRSDRRADEHGTDPVHHGERGAPLLVPGRVPKCDR